MEAFLNSPDNKVDDFGKSLAEALGADTPEWTPKETEKEPTDWLDDALKDDVPTKPDWVATATIAEIKNYAAAHKLSAATLRELKAKRRKERNKLSAQKSRANHRMSQKQKDALIATLTAENRDLRAALAKLS